METTSPSAETTQLKELIESIKTGMLITRTANEELQARPMATIQVDDDCTLWFFTNEFSEKVDEISVNNEVMMNYASGGSNTYVSVKGNAFVCRDKNKMEELYSPAIKAWFPQGLEDPALSLLSIQPIEAEYWNGSASKIAVLFKMARAIITGEEFKDGEYKKVNL